jgi:NAD-dependent deacetylase
VSSPASVEFIQGSADLIAHARHAVALTGAGISTPSGIPDFRSRNSGLWTKYDPFAVASISAFRHHPQKVLDWVRPLVTQIITAKPNPAHRALARLEEAGCLSGIITQNIDGLHEKAGSRQVYEIHGHLRTATCTSCFRKTSTEGLIKPFIEEGAIPVCPSCGALLKPDIVLFGEQLPYDVVQKAENLMQDCDLMLIAGSSLEVTPAATMPIPALNHGAKLIIVNNDPTYLDERADFVFHQDVVDILQRIADEVLHA